MPVVFLLCLVLGLTVGSGLAWATEPSPFSDLSAYIISQQQAFHRSLADAIRALQSGGITAVWGLAFISFMYGVFHAAGPGHGKALIGTYMLSHSSLVKKGVILSFAASFAQGLTAIVLVFGATLLLGISSRDAQSAVPLLEWTSFALIAVIGLILMIRALKALKKIRANAHNNHSHDHHSHDHDATCSSCGHAHGPTVEQLEKIHSLRDALTLVISIGIRPCSGSVLVLVFANVVGLWYAGIAAVMAISLGTAITVSFLALGAVYFRKGALFLAERQSSRLVTTLSISAMFFGGLALVAMGISLLWQVNLTNHPMF